jgi:hypothetical protein
MDDVSLTIDEGQRQLVLLALAHLALERPGFNDALSRIAKLIDNERRDGKPEMFEQFKAIEERLIEETRGSGEERPLEDRDE